MTLRDHVEAELALAQQESDPAAQFAHLERAHILGQYSTRDHVKAHFAMLKWGLREHKPGEVFGQILRIVAAATKTAIGLIPVGNTGGSNVSPVRPMPLPDDLAEIIAREGR